MKDDKKTAVLTAIWNNPAPLFGGQWKQSRNYWQYVAGVDGWPNRTVRLGQSRNGGIKMFFNSGSGRTNDNPDVFAYVQERENTDFRGALEYLAKIYGVTLEWTPEEREKIHRTRLAREAFPALRDALRNNPTGEAATYLREKRRFEDTGDLFGELTAESIAKVKESLKTRGLSYDKNDLFSLGLREDRAKDGYNLVIPYYKNGIIAGFLFRNTNKDGANKYMFSAGLERGFYCQRLQYGKPVYVVEGEMDAIRLIRAGRKTGKFENVIAMGGAQAGEPLAETLAAHGITSVVYVADAATDEQGKKETGIIQKAIKKFQTLTIDGEPVISSLQVVEFPVEGIKQKTDADSYGAAFGVEGLAQFVTEEQRSAWRWELERLTEKMAAQDLRDASEIQGAFLDIYTRCKNTFERERIKHAVGDEFAPLLAQYGITPDSLNNTDEWEQARQYNERIKQGAADLSKAVKEHRDTETIREIISNLQDAQRTDTRAKWDAQLSETFADELAAIKEQPETQKTIWVVGAVTKDKRFIHFENVEFYPADITVFAAQTSHGKTMILCQAAINAVECSDKTYLYISCEESKTQLTFRALNVALDIPNTESGKDANGRPCFIKGTRKKTLRAIIRNGADGAPSAYQTNTAEGLRNYLQLVGRVNAEMERYATTIRPRLKLIYTDGSVESITRNILYYVGQFRKQGVEVGGVFVDYVQLLTSDAADASRNYEMKEICKVLKDCAAVTELPFIVAAQFNRETLKNNVGLDNITVANIGEGADIERIAHDVFLLWQVDKTPTGTYWEYDKNGEKKGVRNMGERSARLFDIPLGAPQNAQLKKGYMYLEQLKARDGQTGGWGLFPYDGERGQIGSIDTKQMGAIK